MKDTRFLRTVVPLALAFLAMAGLALGQAQTGNIYGKIVSEDGSALPGATILLTGGGAAQAFTSDSRGDFRFLNLAPGNFYALKVDLSTDRLVLWTHGLPAPAARGSPTPR